MTKSKLRTISLFLAFIMTICFTAVVQASSTERVLVLPFNMNASQDTTYLQQGVMDMLRSRLQWQNRVIVLPKSDATAAYNKAGGNIDEEKARRIGQSLGADYVLFGSVTMVGESVSLDASLIGVANQQSRLNMFDQAQGLDGVIPKINEFAEKINAQVFRRSGGGETAAAPASSAVVGAPEPIQRDTVADSRRHPDYLLTGEEGKNLSPLNPNFISAVGSDEREGSFWRSPSFPLPVVGMDVGDITGDGANEIVYASRTDLYVVRVQNGVFTKIGKFSGQKGDRILTVDVLDVNGNGKAEIFVSAQNGINLKSASMVLEFNGQKLVPIVSNSPFYFRVVQTPAGPRLMGQREGVGELFSNGVYLMKYSGGKYVSDVSFKIPSGYNLFDFAVANLTGTDKQYFIGINRFENFVVSSRSGQEVWKSSETYASNNNYMEQSRGIESDAGFYEGEGPKQIYFPSRILIEDLDGDGQKEMIVAQNEKSGSKMMSRWRTFKEGRIISVGLRQLSVRENWRSHKLPGAVVDYQIKDYNNDGKEELVAAVVLQQGVGITEGRSTIVAYELASPDEMKKTQEKRYGEE